MTLGPEMSGEVTSLPIPCTSILLPSSIHFPPGKEDEMFKGQICVLIAIFTDQIRTGVCSRDKCPATLP